MSFCRVTGTRGINGAYLDIVCVIRECVSTCMQKNANLVVAFRKGIETVRLLYESSTCALAHTGYSKNTNSELRNTKLYINIVRKKKIKRHELVIF